MSPEEFQRLIPELRPKLVVLATRYLKDCDAAEDIVQDAMLKLWLLRPQLIGSVDAFAAVVVRNLSLNHLRKYRHYQKFSLSEIEQMEDTATDNTDGESTAKLISLVEALPDKQKIILRLHDLEGMDYEQISEMTGTPVATLRQTISRTRRRLRIRYLAAISAAVGLLVAATFGYRSLENYQLRRQYEGSYIIVDGKRNDNLRQILPQLKQTLATAAAIENSVEEQAFIRQAEEEILQSISNPEERKRIKEILQ
ncbi:MAG: RNA polymerase sigma factor [Prevotella sp.]|nr:RNA polymerase sigma factor [Prevotella sp.]MBR6494528.1 RNA polymerase sigma factor [Prevotella sp.]